jgi:hypothetical protein
MHLTQEELKAILHYDPVTGVFTWVGHKRLNGKRAGSSTHGYRRIGIQGTLYAEHRLAFLYMTGEMPVEVDHKNRVSDDNRWENLRAATRSENCQNKKARGVSYHAKTGKWQASIKLHGKRHYLGLYETAEGARAIYVRAKKEMHSLCPDEINDAACETAAAATTRPWRHWSEGDMQIIRDRYPSGGAEECLRLMPHRTRKTIYHKAHELGVKRLDFGNREGV